MAHRTCFGKFKILSRWTPRYFTESDQSMYVLRIRILLENFVDLFVNRTADVLEGLMEIFRFSNHGMTRFNCCWSFSVAALLVALSAWNKVLSAQTMPFQNYHVEGCHLCKLSTDEVRGKNPEVTLAWIDLVAEYLSPVSTWNVRLFKKDLTVFMICCETFIFNVAYPKVIIILWAENNNKIRTQILCVVRGALYRIRGYAWFALYRSLNVG